IVSSRWEYYYNYGYMYRADDKAYTYNEDGTFTVSYTEGVASFTEYYDKDSKLIKEIIFTNFSEEKTEDLGGGEYYTYKHIDESTTTNEYSYINGYKYLSSQTYENTYDDAMEVHTIDEYTLIKFDYFHRTIYNKYNSTEFVVTGTETTKIGEITYIYDDTYLTKNYDISEKVNDTITSKKGVEVKLLEDRSIVSGSYEDENLDRYEYDKESETYVLA
ncbi:MAG: hypothetical protein K6A63_03785, partial [Acholeplasmatales bacterium]|nr:hypothetical protein [Acholeplasmatales bacterium]